MLTIKDLGKKLRRQFPELSHLTDEKIGRAAKRAAENKGSREYDKYIDPDNLALQPTQSHITGNPDAFKSLMKEVVGHTDTLVRAKGLDESAEKIMKSFNLDAGFFSSFTAKHTSNNQLKWIQNLTEIQNLTIKNFLAVAQGLRDGKVSEIQFKKFVAESVVALMEIQAEAQRVEAAALRGITPQKHTQLLEDKLAHEQELYFHKQGLAIKKEELDIETQNRITEARAMSQIRIEEQVEIAEGLADVANISKTEDAQREWERFKNEKDMDIQVVMLANLQEVAEISYLTKSLMGLVENIRKMKSLPNANDLTDSIQILEDSREKLKLAIDERFDGLLQSTKKGRKDIRPVEETEADSGI